MTIIFGSSLISSERKIGRVAVVMEDDVVGFLVVWWWLYSLRLPIRPLPRLPLHLCGVL